MMPRIILLTTASNPASKGIAEELIRKHGFSMSADGEWERNGVRMVETGAASVLEVPTDFDADCLMVLSTHRSKTPGRMLTTHVPGNWDAAGMGGKPRTLNPAPARMLKAMLKGLKREGDAIGWPVSLEADHHGPASEKPIMFVEIGNGPEQWGDASAISAVAKAVISVLDDSEGIFKEKSVAAFGVGGGHYPKTFTRLMLETDIAVGHVIPKYSIDSMDEDVFRQAIEKNVEKVDRVLIAKDETNSAQKERVRTLCASAGIRCELI